MQKMSKEELLKPRKKWGCWILFTLFFFSFGAVAFAAGFFTEPTLETSDGYSRRNFFFIFGGLWMLGWGVGFLIILAVSNVEKKYRKTLLEHGQYGRAIVLKIEEVGDSEGSPIMVELRLEIHLEGLAPYQVEEKAEIPITKIPQLQVGSTVEVLAVPAIPGVRMGAVKLIYK